MNWNVSTSDVFPSGKAFEDVEYLNLQQLIPNQFEIFLPNVSIKGLEDQKGVHGQIVEVDEENEESMGHNQPPVWWKGAMNNEREKFTEELDTMLSAWSSNTGLDRMS